MTNLVTNYNFLFIIFLVTNNFLFYKLISKLVTIVTNNFWSLKLVTNEIFSCSVLVYATNHKSHLLLPSRE